MVPAPISGVDGADGPHVDGVDLEAFIYGSGRDGFLECVREPPLDVDRVISLPNTVDARL